MKTTFMYQTTDRECGNVIDEFDNEQEALEALASYERIDREEGNYTPDFYEVKALKQGFFIYDRTANDGKNYINTDSGNNQSDTDNALAFDTNEEALRHIEECGISEWASVMMSEYIDLRAN